MKLRLLTLESDPLTVISSPDAIILSKPRMRLDTAYAIYARWSGDPIRVYGAYQRVEGGRYLRRVSGGPDILASPGGAYLAVVREYKWSLETLVRDTSSLVECLGGRLEGGRINGGVVGFTKIAGFGVTEVLLEKDPGADGILQCLQDSLGKIASVEELDKDLIPSMALKRNSSQEWLRPGRPYNIEASSGSNGYTIRFTSWVEDGIIHWIDLDGVFYASPPSQVYALIDTVTEALPSPGLVYEFAAAWSTFVDTAGISVDDVRNAFEELVAKAEAFGQ